jgi:hypothetical protein
MKFEPPGIYIQLATEGGPGIIGTLLWVSVHFGCSSSILSFTILTFFVVGGGGE